MSRNVPPKPKPNLPKKKQSNSAPESNGVLQIDNPWQLIGMLIHRLALPGWAILLLLIIFVSLGVGGLANIIVALINKSELFNSDKIASVMQNGIQQGFQFAELPVPKNIFKETIASTGKLKSDGSTSMVQVMREFQKDVSNFQVIYGTDNTEPNGSEIGKRRLKNGEIQLALLSEALTKEDKSQGLRSIPIGKDGIAVVVHKDNPIPTLTREQLRKIYTCEITDWDTVGWSDNSSQSPKGITVINRSNDSGTQRVFKDRVLKDGSFCPDTSSKREDGSSFKTWEKDQTTVVLRNIDRYGIYFASLNHVIEDSHVKILEIDGVPPNPVTILGERYPLTRDLFAAAQENTTPEVLEFMNFMVSPKGQKILSNYHIPIYEYQEK